MSIALMTAAWALDIGATDKIVLLALADHANDDGYCWPGNASLQRKCGLSERAVRLAMRSLQDAGHLTCHFTTGKSTSYHIHPGTSCPRQDMPPAPRAATPAPRAPKSSRTIISPTEATPLTVKADAKRKPDALPDWVPAEAWTGFVDMRRRTGHPLTQRAAALTLQKLKTFADLGQPPGDVLDQSTMNGWRGIFELKDWNNGNTIRGNDKPMGRNNGPSVGHRRNPAMDMLRDALGDDMGGFAGSPQADAGASGGYRGIGLALPAR